MYTQIIRPLQGLLHRCCPTQPTPATRKNYTTLLRLPPTIQ
jgi:hypothetical protein